MGMAYDAAHGQVVLFGGFNTRALGDTWTWDGAAWAIPTRGRSTTQVTIPATATAGNQRVKAKGNGSGQKANRAFTVT